MKDELEDRVADMLRSLTEMLAESPVQLLTFYNQLLTQFKDNPEALKGVQQLTEKFISKIPEMTSTVSDATKVLETYLTYKISKRQEEATERLLKQNRLLSYSTFFLALGTFALVLVTVFHL
jgi:hypothetical protein